MMLWKLQGKKKSRKQVWIKFIRQIFFFTPIMVNLQQKAKNLYLLF